MKTPPERAKGNKSLRWYTGVPIGTNPLILMDMATILAILWGAAALTVTLLQIFFGDALTALHLQGAVLFASYLVLLGGGVFLAVSFLLLQNRYIALYRFDDEGAYCESMRRGKGPLAESLHWRPFPVKPLNGPARTAKKSVPWGDIQRAELLEGMRVILLKARRGTALRVYCPDSRICSEALRFAEEKIKIQGKGAEA